MKNDRCCYSSPKDIVFAVLVLTSSKHGPSFKLLKSSLEYSTYPTLQTCVLVSHLEKEVNLAKLKSQERLTKKRLPQTSHTKLGGKRKVQSIVIFSLGILNNDGFEKEA